MCPSYLEKKTPDVFLLFAITFVIPILPLVSGTECVEETDFEKVWNLVAGSKKERAQEREKIEKEVYFLLPANKM